jgi:hypothetical protein
LCHDSVNAAVRASRIADTAAGVRMLQWREWTIAASSVIGTADSA